MLSAAVLFLSVAADLNGIWLGHMVRPNGDKIDISMKLTQTGDRIGGKLYGDFRSNPVVEGTVTGDEVTFVVLATEQAGNEINQSRLKFTGRFVNANELELTRERESVRSASNAGNSATTATPPPKQAVKLKRLL